MAIHTIPSHVLFESALLTESLVFNSNDLLYRFDDWVNRKSNVLLITGYCGSGKTTRGKLIAEKHNARFISLDKKANELFGLDRYLKDADADYAIKIFNSIKRPTVFEATQLMTLLTPKQASKYSVILLGKSYLVSTFKATMRDTDGYPWKGTAAKHFVKINKYYMAKYNEYYRFFKNKRDTKQK